MPSTRPAPKASPSQGRAFPPPGALAAAHNGEGPPAAQRPRASRRKALSRDWPEGAHPAPLPAQLRPQLATLVDEPPALDGWAFEMKFDGYRLLARVQDGQARLFTRNGHDWTDKMPSLARALAALPLQEAWLDGEIIVAGEGGAPDFQRLQNAFDASHTDDIRYFLFDLPWLDGHDLSACTLSARRALLQALLKGASAPLCFSEAFDAHPADLLDKACSLGMEGVMGKRLQGGYRQGRSADWIKLKCKRRQEFVIGGFTDPKGSRVGLGSLLLGVHDEQGHLRYAGNVGAGFDARTLKTLRAQLDALGNRATPFKNLPRGVKGHWVQPRLVAEVSFAEWTKDGRVRQAVFHGLRQDKPAGEIGREHAAHLPARKARARKSSSPMQNPIMTVTSTAATKAKAKAQPAKGDTFQGVRLTHPDRVIDPSTGVTKRDLARYYEAAAPLILPHLKQRPVSLVRGPEGIGGELFFQKHGDKRRIAGITTLDPALDPGNLPLLQVDTPEALMGCVQMNVIELHTWNALSTAIDKPNRMVFDLDPGEGVPWPRMIEAAQLVRSLLQELSLESWLKTSGGKGLHVVVPLLARWDWDTVRELSHAVVNHLAATLPDRFAAKSGPRNRVGKIFADYLRNGRGATTAAAWSARARPGLGVSVPVSWDELPQLRGGDHWTVKTAPERFAGPDPWGDYARGKQSIAAALKALRVGKS